MSKYQSTAPVTSMDQIYADMRQPHPDQATKCIDHIDDHIAAWIAKTTFLVMSTYDAGGRVDCSPKGDPAGFVHVVNPTTLAIPDRPGNHRYDGFRNILETGRIGLVLLVPNRNEVVRINGAAQVVRDPDLRETLAIKGRVPDFAVLVHVEEAFFHCGKAIIRSQLWKPDIAAAADGLPTYAAALLSHAAEHGSPEDLTARLENNDKNRLYDE